MAKLRKAETVSDAFYCLVWYTNYIACSEHHLLLQCFFMQVLSIAVRTSQSVLIRFDLANEKPASFLVNLLLTSLHIYLYEVYIAAICWLIDSRRGLLLNLPS